MLVLVSFVLVLAAAVTLVVGLLQSGLTLIYLSIACSVLAGIVLAVAVLRGRPEPKPVAAGRPYMPPQPAPVPASVSAPAASTQSTTSWSPPTPAPPPPPPSPPAAGGDDSATKAAGAALLGRLRGKRADKGEAPADEAPAAARTAIAEPVGVDAGTTQMPAMAVDEDGDGFPIADYDRLRATELLSRLPSLDRNQLEAVREREAAGKNRFTIMSRVDSLLATTADAAWEADDEDAVVSEVVVAVAASVEEDEADELDDDAFLDDEEDDEPIAMPAGDIFPIAGYDTLTVGQILPRLSDLGPDELVQVRTREEAGRRRGTILDRIDRLASRAAPLAMPPAAAAPARKAPAGKAPVRKAPARKAAAVAAPVVTETSGPASKRVAKPPVRKAAAPARKGAAGKVTPVAADPSLAFPKKLGSRKTAPAKVTAAPAKGTAAPAKGTAAPRKARAPKAMPPVVPAAPAAAPAKKARAKAKKTDKA